MRTSYLGICPECGQQKKIRHNTKEKLCYNCYEVDLRKRSDKAIVTISIDRTEYTKVKEFARINNCSVAETFRTFVTWGLEDARFD